MGDHYFFVRDLPCPSCGVSRDFLVQGENAHCLHCDDITEVEVRLRAGSSEWEVVPKVVPTP